MTHPVIPADAATSRGVYDALEALRGVLISGEQLLAMAVQRRMFALRHRRRAVGATTGRFIMVKRGLFGGFTPVDVRWQDVRECSINSGPLGATLRVVAYRLSDLASAEGPPTTIVVKGLRKDEAREVYRVCEANAQAWREKRRIRDLEELRAKSGGLQVGGVGGGPSYTPASDGSDRSPTARLQRAKEMRESGLLTDAEYEQVKAKILAEL